MNFLRPFIIVTTALTLSGPAVSGETSEWLAVSGEGIHYFSTSVKHSETPTETGSTSRSSDIVSLTGDLSGTILYHITTDVDGAAGTLTNTGHQVFSGTVLGGEPVLILDDTFRFDINLATGEVLGNVLLNQTLAGEPTVCRLTVKGTGETTEAGDSRVVYDGDCKTGDAAIDG